MYKYEFTIKVEIEETGDTETYDCTVRYNYNKRIPGNDIDPEEAASVEIFNFDSDLNITEPMQVKMEKWLCEQHVSGWII